jgi:hypothetical protein
MNYKFVELNLGSGKPVEDKDVPKNIFDENMVSLIVGKMGQGKSTLLSEMILNPDLLGKKYSQILFFTPNEIPKIPRNDFFCNNLDLCWLIEKLEKYNQICLEKKVNGKILVIFDDMVSEIFDERNNSEFQKLILNRRHQYPGLTLSYLFTTQYFKLFPKKYRHILNYIIIFSIDASEWDNIMKDYLFNKKDKDAISLRVQSHFKKSDHNFICLNLYKHLLFYNFSSCQPL